MSPYLISSVINYVILFFYFRELLWHTFIELLTSVLPSINIHLIKTWVKKTIGINNASYNNEKTLHTDVQYKDSNRKHNIIQKQPLLECKICKESPIILPSSAGCGHYFCYYCIAANLGAVGDEGFACPVCGMYLKKEKMNLPTSVRNV